MCPVGASIGLAFDLDGMSSATSILRDADLAVYRAKASGRGTVEVYDRALRAEIERRNDLEDAFRRALGSDDIWAVYQPLVDTSVPGGRIRSLEALVRWNRPGEGMVSPAEFVPVIERGPHIVALGEHILADALAAVARWRTLPGYADLTVAVNLSTRHLASLGWSTTSAAPSTPPACPRRRSSWR